MAWYPGAVKKPIHKNFTKRTPRYDAIILHTDAGNARDLYGWWNHPANDDASSHFHVAKDGTVFQYVDTAYMSWTSGEASSRSIGVETQGYGNEPWTDAQITSLAALIRWGNKTHGIPIRAMNSSRSTERGVGWHRLGVNGSFPAPPSILAGRAQRGGGEVWSKASGKLCPGTARILQIPTILNMASKNLTHPVKDQPVIKTDTPLIGDKKSIWPEHELPLTNEHTKDSHNAWGRLMLDIGVNGGPLGLSLQHWLMSKKYYGGELDANFGPLSVKALQSFLGDRGYYKGALDGNRGSLTVKAEISYLNDQRRHYTKPKIESPSIVPTKEDEMTPEQMNEIKKHITAEVERVKGEILSEPLVSWRDSQTGETKRASIPAALGYLSLHWVREVGRDNELGRKLAGGSNADSSQPAPDSPPIQTPEVPNTEAITPTAPTEGPSA